MVNTNDYDPATALTAYFPDRQERRTARLWAREKLLHDMQDAGMIAFFEGPGTDPTGLTGYASTKVWLRVSSGVTDAPGEIRQYDGSGSESDLANWPALTASALASLIGAFNLAQHTSDNITEGSTKLLMTVTERGKVLGAPVTPEMHGYTGSNLAADTVALQSAIDTGYCSLGDNEYDVSDVSLSGMVVADGAIINIAGRVDDIASSLCAATIIGRLTIAGETTSTVSIVSAAEDSNGTFSVEYYSGDVRSAKYQIVDITLSAPAAQGNMLLIDADQPELSGCFEVLSVAGNVAKVLMTAQGTLDLATMTGTARILTTVRQFDDITMVLVDQGRLTLEDIGFLGACYPVTNGNRGNVYDPAGTLGGVTGIIARQSGWIKGTRCGISGVSGTQLTSVDAATIDWTESYASCGGRNGQSSGSSSKGTFGTAISTQNLLDGFISQDGSFAFATSIIAAHNGRHGAISSGGSNLNGTSGQFYDNGHLDPTNGDGFSVAEGRGTAISIIAKRNALCGMRAIGNSSIRATSVDIQENEHGILSDTRSNVLATGTVDNNNTTDLWARNGGKLSAIGVTHTTASPTAGKMDGTGALVQTTSTIPDLATNAGINVGSGGVIKRIVRLRVASVDFGSIGAGGQLTTTAAMTGVVAADDSIVIVNNDSTAPRTGIIFDGAVSADNEVLIRAVNFTSSPIDPPALNLNVVVIQF